MRKDEAKIISLVPSWTETLIECGVKVLGRTRFCIHPAEKVSEISIFGGTKTYDLPKLIQLRPDYVVLDKEENKRELAEALEAVGIKTVVSHVTSIESAIDFLSECSKLFSNVGLAELASRYENILKNKFNLSIEKFWQEVAISNQSIENRIPQKSDALIYLIWKNPFMCVAEGTFIWQQFELFNLKLSVPEGYSPDINSAASKYPEVNQYELKKYHCLLSTEPFPFEKNLNEFSENNLKYTLVDGEKLSWYGIRNLKFLENCLN